MPWRGVLCSVREAALPSDGLLFAAFQLLLCGLLAVGVQIVQHRGSQKYIKLAPALAAEVW